MTAQVAAPSETAAVAAIAAMLHQSTHRPVQQDTERLYDPKLPEALRSVRDSLIVCALLDRLSDDLEQLANDRALADEQRATTNAALMLAFIAREELDPMAA
jgi:hypothetical protein